MFPYIKQIVAWGAAKKQAEEKGAAPSDAEFSKISTFYTDLKQASANTPVMMGTTVKYDALGDAEYSSVLKENYSVISSADSCDINTIVKNQYTFDYSNCDQISYYAQQHGMKMRANLMNPTNIWVGSTSPSAKEGFMQNYIIQTVRHVKYPDVWNVVNQPLQDSGALKTGHTFEDVPDYICKAFKWAHLANADAKLYISDYGVLSATGDEKTKSDALYNLVKDLKSRNCPVHGVGLQAHITTNYLNEGLKNDGEGIRQNMKRYADLGVETQITEVEVRCNGDWSCTKTSWDYEAEKTQANIYGSLLTVCLTEINCNAFETWGFTNLHAHYPNSLPFYTNYKKKSAYYKMLYVLNHHQLETPRAQTTSFIAENNEFFQLDAEADSLKYIY